MAAWGWFLAAQGGVVPLWAVGVDGRDGPNVWVLGVLEEVSLRDNNRVALDIAPARLLAGDGVVREIEGVRVTVAAKRAEALKIGKGVAAEVQLFGPTGPKFAGDRDDRWGWWYGDGRTVKGYVRGRLEPSMVEQADKGWFEQAREAVVAGVGTLGNGVVAALLVGDGSKVAPGLYEAYRASGLLHLLVISGLQMTIVAGGLFWLVRRGLVWLPYIGERAALFLPVRGIAAVVALVGVALYAALVGGEVSVLRAVLMVALGLGALLVGRGRDLLRAWALVLAGMLLIWPEWGWRAGFQLSFAAVLGLILWGIAHGEGWVRGWWGKLRAMVESTLVVSLFTAPILAWHFGAVPLAGVVANVVAIPLMAVATWLGMAVLVLWPLGWQALPLAAMTEVVAVTNEVAVRASGWPGAVLRIGNPPEREVFCCDFGGVVKVDGVYYAFEDTAPWVLGQWERRWGVKAQTAE